MFDQYIIRLQKEDKGLKPLPYVVWADAASIPRPESIKPFDSSVNYSVNSVISDGEGRLLVAKRQPELGYSRDKVETAANLNSDYDSECKLVEYNGKTYLVTAQAGQSQKISALTGATAITGNKLVIQEWDATTGALSPVGVILNVPLENLEVFEIEGNLYITGGVSQGNLLGKTRIWKFDGVTLSAFTTFEKFNHVLYYKLGTRHFFAGFNYDTDSLKLYQWTPYGTELVTEVTELTGTLLPNERFVDVNYQIFNGVLYMFVVKYDVGGDKSTISTYRFDNIRKTLVFVRSFDIDDQILHISPQEINREFYLHVALKDDFLHTYKLNTQTIELTLASKLPKIFDYQGIDTDISGLVLNTSFFYEDDEYYLNVPVLLQDGALDALSVTCRWDATLQQYIPFKGYPTYGATDWQVLETDKGIFSVITNHRDTVTTSGESAIIGWDNLTKKFTATLSEVIGGSVWNNEDWEELQTATCLVAPFNTVNKYRPDMYVLDTDDTLLRLRTLTPQPTFYADDWETIHPRQRISTLYFYANFNSMLGSPQNSTGVVVQIEN
ncbi:hypothetical protein SM033_00308 [Vibrio phage vB_VpaM_sm033]|nr:hypothetical protein SM033_00308 [Vibrio phage vB_VpaM_sm033]